jgi:glyoxalase family protein
MATLVKGIHQITVCVSSAQEDIDFMTAVVGQRRPARTLILHHEPDRNQGSWGFGAGTGHHIALELENDVALAQQKVIYEEQGYTDCSEIKDRNYFHSIYVRSPGGILTECAATADGGFTPDEAWEKLGTSLLLPPWFEEQRESIVAMLEPIEVPETRR